MQRSLATVMAAAFLFATVAAAQDPAPVPVKKAVPALRKALDQPEESALAAKRQASKRQKAKPQVGVASWYGGSFHGRSTASGEQYDMHQLTAAHPTLPLGTMIKVTNLRNGKFVVLRVNDRGPYVENRIVDVSYSAAKLLQFSENGIARVRIETVQLDTMAKNNLSAATE